MTAYSAAIHPVLWYSNKTWVSSQDNGPGKAPTSFIVEEIDSRLKDFMEWNQYPNNITEYNTANDFRSWTGPGQHDWTPKHCYNSSSYLEPKRDAPIIASIGENEVTDAVDLYITSLF